MAPKKRPVCAPNLDQKGDMKLLEKGLHKRPYIFSHPPRERCDYIESGY